MTTAVIVADATVQVITNFWPVIAAGVLASINVHTNRKSS